MGDNNRNINEININTPIPLPPPHPTDVSGVEGVILGELKYIRTRVDQMAGQVAVHESKLDTGNRSERVSAFIAFICMVLMIFSLAVATQKGLMAGEVNKDIKTNERVDN